MVQTKVKNKTGSFILCYFTFKQLCSSQFSFTLQAATGITSSSTYTCIVVAYVIHNTISGMWDWKHCMYAVATGITSSSSSSFMLFIS